MMSRGGDGYGGQQPFIEIGIGIASGKVPVA